MLVCIPDEELLNKCFNEWLDRHSEVKNNNDLRCAIVAYSLYVQHTLADLYDVGVEEYEEPSNGCKNCIYSYSDEKNDLFCKDHDWMAVDGDDMCSDWEEGE